MEKTYVFIKLTGSNTVERVEKPESELSSTERKLLLGELIRAWNNTPSNQQNEFIARMYEDWRSMQPNYLSTWFGDPINCLIDEVRESK